MSSAVSPTSESRRRRTRVLIAAATAAVIAAAGVSVWFATRGDSAPPAAAPSAPAASATPTAPGPEVTPSAPASADAVVPGDLILTSDGGAVDVFESAGGDSATETLEPWSLYGSPTTLLGFDTTEVNGEAWVEVELVGSPNHRRGWVREDDVAVSSTSTAVHVYLAERELDLSVDGAVTRTAPVVIGDPASPTPLGVFWVTDPLDFTANDTGVYGAYALGLNGYSEVLDEFNGGPPQIAIHGTNQPELLGQAVSNGCIRVSNEDVLALADATGLGTPVIIHASRDAAA